MTSRRPRTAFAAPAWASEQRVGDVGTKATLLLLANYADEDYSCFPGQERIADETEQSVSTVYRQIKRLEALNLIHREKRYDHRGKRNSDRFYLHLDVTVDVRQSEDGLGLPVNLTGSQETAGQDPTTGQQETGSCAESTTGHAESTTGHPCESLPVTGDGGTPRGTPRGRTPREEARTREDKPEQDSLLPTDEPSAQPKAKRRSQVPEDFRPSGRLLVWAAENAPGVTNLARETQRFIDYHRSKGNTFLDHDRAWRTWISREQTDAERRSRSARPPRQAYSDRGRWDREGDVRLMTAEEMDAAFGVAR